ncbi:MAG: urease subunit beta [Actinobacteria bacterium]|jgi:urease beta subunit|nr:urease subunit beta [Actinomycetota bacterium]
MIPGEIFLKEEDIILNENLESLAIEVRNSGDRPIQVGSHFHFFETNSALEFNRETAIGKRLNIASGTAVRFEPGQTKIVSLIKFSADQPGGTPSHDHHGIHNL